MLAQFRSASLLTTLAVLVFTALVSVNVLWQGTDGDGWKQTIRSDAKGYYGYLVALFIRNDLGHEAPAVEYIHETPTGTLNKYFCGTSLMMAPWFLIGHDLALGDPKVPHDGFSRYELKAISVGGWVYLLLGLLALRKLLLGLGVRDAVVALILLGLGAATPLLQYAAVQPGWSHIYSFCTISVFLLVVHRLANGAQLKWTVVAAAMLGVIVLLRPVNALIVLALPIVAGAQSRTLIERLLKRPATLLLACVTGLAVVFIQSLLWHAQTGNWLEWGYRHEGFHWDRPEVFEVLFGFRRGLFLWTPLLLPASASAFLLWRHDRLRSAASLVYWVVVTYVISAWWIWYYGSGFGSRVYIDHYPVLVIPLALVMQHWKHHWWTAARIFVVACIALHLAQFAQFHQGILHVESMDRTRYAYTFLRFGDEYRHVLGGNDEVPPYHPRGLESVLVAATDLERESPHWLGGRIERRPEAYSGGNVCVFDEATPYGSTFIAPAGSLPIGRELFLEVVLHRYEEHARDSFEAIAITSVQSPDSTFRFYKSFRMNPMPGTRDGTWERLTYRIPVVALRPGEELRFFVWNQHGRSRFLLDDLFLRVWAVKPY